MNFNLDPDQQAIVDSTSRLFNDYCSDQTIKQLAGEDYPFHQSLWQQLADLGILGLAIDERYGGAGLSLVELCLILESQGRTLAPLPLLSSLVESMMTLADSDNTELKQQLLPAINSGQAILAPVRGYCGWRDYPALTLVANTTANATANASTTGWSINGRSGFVPYLHAATGYVVNVNNSIVYVDAQTAGITSVEQRAISGEVGGYILFKDTPVAANQLIAEGHQGERIVEQQCYRSWIALAALQVGILDEGLRRAAEYLSQRKQFGRPLGAFQAVSQQAADAYMDVESLRSVYWRAIDDVEQGADLQCSATVAKYWAANAGHRVAHKFLHLHGGIGQDLSYPLHRYFLWAKQTERYLGTASQITPRLGAHLAAEILAE